MFRRACRPTFDGIKGSNSARQPPEGRKRRFHAPKLFRWRLRFHPCEHGFRIDNGRAGAVHGPPRRSFGNAFGFGNL